MTESKRTYQFSDSRLHIQFGDITKSNDQVIVSSDDTYLTMSGGVSKAILNAGGNSIALDASKKVPAVLGDIVATTAGTLPAQYVFHAVTLQKGETKPAADREAIIRKITQRCLQVVDVLNLQSISFPAIGAGTAGFPYEDVAVQMADVISTDLVKRKRPIEVTLFLYDHSGKMQPLDFLRFFEEFAKRAPRVAEHETAAPAPAQAAPASAGSTSTGTESGDDAQSKRLQNLRRLLASLEDQRFKLEERLIAGLEQEKEEDAERLRGQLRENEELRLGYQKELRTLTSPAAAAAAAAEAEAPRTLRVFVSSTYRDLVPHREAIKDQIARRDLLFRGMEHFGADPTRSPAKLIVEEVRKADIYAGVFGVRYGSVDPATGKSMTELEFDEAAASGKPMLIYVIRDDAPVRVSDIESSPEGKAKLDAFKRRILNTYTVYMFTTVEDLARQVYEDLAKATQALSKGQASGN